MVFINKAVESVVGYEALHKAFYCLVQMVVLSASCILACCTTTIHVGVDMQSRRFSKTAHMYGAIRLRCADSLITYFSESFHLLHIQTPTKGQGAKTKPTHLQVCQSDIQVMFAA
jgi:hypothetical protein